MANEPIAYTYEADHHCEGCALERFGRDEHGFITGTDNEGNEVGIVSPWDEWYNLGEGNQTLSCGTCGGVIEEHEEEEKTYSIYRFYRDPDKDREHILDGLSLEDAQEHCNNEETHGDGWFDGYEVEK